MTQTISISEFHNEPLLDFSHCEVWNNIQTALCEVRSTTFGTIHPLIIGGEEKRTKITFSRKNPSDVSEIVGFISSACLEDVTRAIAVAKNSRQAKEWASRSLGERAEYLRKTADGIREKRYFFIALMMLEVGKSAHEADGEVCEAIDLLRYYADCAELLDQLNSASLRSLPGEKNTGRYIPIGVPPIGISIQPWNFPLAISAGPLGAGLVTGHAMIYKPAEQSSITGYHLAKTFLDAGIPEDILCFLSGEGESVGRELVRHPAVKAIAFTGSKAVREEIEKSIFTFNHTLIHDLPPSERFPKKAAALEAGGKNVIIIDNDADIDEALVAICDSAFGFSGQKCSACSRLIVTGNRGFYSALIERLSEAVQDMPVGPPEMLKYIVGPLIDRCAYERVAMCMADAKSEKRLVVTGTVDPEYVKKGYFLPPMLVEESNCSSLRSQKEIFGPLLSVFWAKDFDEAIRMANDTEYALTAGVYSRNPEHVQRAISEINAGNIYINKKITGAIVARQPFGGHKMSGNGTKAGGWDYLLSFMDRQHISEDTMRRGTPIE
ncbi:MAG: hypothetical protein BMS9Abin13_203 [Patescibacteria group bacterium]|nr:MAG: hypothetical protein BMS9Abin13_203 [Patescibacteria group bacterium]